MTDTHARSLPPEVRGRELPTVTGVAMSLGIVLALVGILGFIPGATKHIDFHAGLRFSGTASKAEIFDVFRTSILHNLIFLFYGILGAVASFFVLSARLYLFLGGIVFLFLGIYGLAVDEHSAANFLPMNGADNVLHLVLGVVMVLLGVVYTVTRRAR